VSGEGGQDRGLAREGYADQDKPKSRPSASTLWRTCDGWGAEGAAGGGEVLTFGDPAYPSRSRAGLPCPRRRPIIDAMLLTNARIYTMDAVGSVADSLVVREGRIAFCGRRADVNPSAGEPIVDLHGHAVLPGSWMRTGT
jgi:hypothetical protein